MPYIVVVRYYVVMAFIAMACIVKAKLNEFLDAPVPYIVGVQLPKP